MTGLQTPLFACKVSKRLLPLPALLASCLAIAAASSSCCAFSQASSRCVGCSSVPPLTKRDMATLLPAVLVVCVGVDGCNTLVTGQTLEVNLEWLKANLLESMRRCASVFRCAACFSKDTRCGVWREERGQARVQGQKLRKVHARGDESLEMWREPCRRCLSCQSILHTLATHSQCDVDDG